jgi:hypothetical protein
MLDRQTITVDCEPVVSVAVGWAGAEQRGASGFAFED